jgi:ketosteroid isomerase-like protein
MKVLTTLFMIGMITTAVAMADDVDDVKAAVQRYFVAINSGDTEGVYQFRIAERSSFGRGGQLLGKPTASLEEQKRSHQNQVNAGRKRNYQLRHMEVTVYGGDTAIVTGYLTGRGTFPDGTVVPHNDRRTALLIKQGGQWKEVHTHQSLLRTPQ